MRLVRHKGHQPTHTHTTQTRGLVPPLTETPAHDSWTGLWDAVIGLWAFLSLLRLLWLLSLVEFYGVCTHGILNIRTAKRWSLNECTVKLSSTPSVVRTVRIEYRHGWGELPPNVQTFSIRIFVVFLWNIQILFPECMETKFMMFAQKDVKNTIFESILKNLLRLA